MNSTNSNGGAVTASSSGWKKTTLTLDPPELPILDRMPTMAARDEMTLTSEGKKHLEKERKDFDKRRKEAEKQRRKDEESRAKAEKVIEKQRRLSFKMQQKASKTSGLPSMDGLPLCK